MPVLVVPERSRSGVGMVFLGQQPSGVAVDIENTDELVPGDVIYMEFPFGSRGYLRFGSSASFTVFGFDKRPGVNKVGVRDSSGKEWWFDGGFKETLLSSLRAFTSYTKVLVIRKNFVGPVQGPEPLVITEDRQFVIDHITKRFPEMRPVLVRTASELAEGDYLVSYMRPLDRLVVWRIGSTSDPNRIERIVVFDSKGGFKEGEVMYLAAWNPLYSWEMAFIAPKPFPWGTILLAGGLALAGFGVYSLIRG